MEKREKLKQKIIKELDDDRRLDSFFNEFRADTIQPFKEQYAFTKANLLLNGEVYIQNKQNRDLHFHKEAEEILWHIQQKKLFDIQCLWRAERIKLEGVDIIEDFNYWSVDIKRCPFLPPITVQEMELLMQYVQSHSYDEPLFSIFSWQDYNTYKEEHLGEHESLSMPEWYHYYNMHRGTESLLLLPDIRGEKEEGYQNNGLKDIMDKKEVPFTDREDRSKPKTKAKKVEEKYDMYDPPPYVSPEIIGMGDTRPWINNDWKKGWGEFINLFENSELKKVHEARIRLSENNLERFDYWELEDAFDTLRLSVENYAMEPYFAWKDGIIRLAQKFKKDKIAEALPLVFEQYLFKVENNIVPFINRQETQDIKRAKASANDHKRWILRGRKLQGEPMNFDF
jgi:hypothetical protein